MLNVIQILEMFMPTQSYATQFVKCELYTENEESHFEQFFFIQYIIIKLTMCFSL